MIFKHIHVFLVPDDILTYARTHMHFPALESISKEGSTTDERILEQKGLAVDGGGNLDIFGQEKPV